MTTTSTRFKSAIQVLKKLKKHSDYQGAFIFGSAARNEITDDSDLDVVVVTDRDNCSNLNHPIIGGVKLDISFLSYKQLIKQSEEQVSSKRMPFLVESKILFDKKGLLFKLKKKLKNTEPPKVKNKDDIQFEFFHANNKAERNITKDPLSSLLNMNMGLPTLLKRHYQLNGQWWVSDKRLLKDLTRWDKPLWKLVGNFLSESDVKSKFKIWTIIVDHILKPIGGRKKVDEIGCGCKVCENNLKKLRF
ncbi:MAG: nucleotidyltransferase domain-containing protein [Candidatus Yanofskybacteria bacterium]|nr:nucleotidyltransferase domain-containing protein [Candidatus Yanofskybacteria bacterium]